MGSYDNVDTHLSGGYLNLETGDNSIRIVSFPAVLKSHWKDKKKLGSCIGDECDFCESSDEDTAKRSTRFLFNIIDRRDGQGKIAEFPPSVMSKIRKYQKEGDASYDTEVAPYDFIITKEGSGFNTKYDVRAARENKELTVDEEAIVKKMTPIEDVVAKALERSSADDEYDEEAALDAIG